MPRKKGGFDQQGKFGSPSLPQAPRSYASLLYGALTVIVIFAIVFLGLRSISQRGTVTEEAGKTEEPAPQTHEVKEGDSLWAIAEKFYKDPYKWTEIAKANKISNPDVIEKGMKLTIPTIPEAKKSTVAKQEEKITGNSYKVIEGDTLWVIALRAYGDPYKWVKIAEENKLISPDLIHPGNQFKLPR